MTKKVAINKCHGGFGLSLKALEMLAELKGHGKLHHYLMDYEDRVYKKITAEGANERDVLFRHTFTENIGDNLPEDDFYSHFEKSNYAPEYERHDADLIKVIETLGKEASGGFSRLEIVEIPKEVDYQIEEYDGLEWIAEKHSTWG